MYSGLCQTKDHFLKIWFSKNTLLNKNFLKIWNFFEKKFFAQISKWWVNRISGSLFKKISEAPQAEEWSLKIFLEASFSKNFGSSKTLKNSPWQILQNFAPKTGPSRQIDGLLHNVALDFQFVQRFRKKTRWIHIHRPHCNNFWRWRHLLR